MCMAKAKFGADKFGTLGDSNNRGDGLGPKWVDQGEPIEGPIGAALMCMAKAKFGANSGYPLDGNNHWPHEPLYHKNDGEPSWGIPERVVEVFAIFAPYMGPGLLFCFQFF
ncbi:hypothetical protein GOP47_0004333 [Adiantum capillus-veneris]|uniref:Uncharacterized protein n=1 Tax=Adiantum capillus-veneris TaxID=13818 RepID=A0A9D4V7A7_ADICA|nr:hypothetical protein GOP47_0004333 [Adiantum capillus-veneris]